MKDKKAVTLPLVSIITPCYNQGEYLAETLESVLRMTYCNWECIIINDGSTDDTEIVANKYVNLDKRFTYLFQQNQGVCVAKNAAIKLSHGKYILPLDSDDIIESSFVEKAVDYMEKDKDCKLVYCDVKYFGAKQGRHNHQYTSFRHLLHLNCFCNSSLFRRIDFDKTDGYHLNMKDGWEDWDFWISLLKNGGDTFHLPMVGLCYRIKPSSRNRIGSVGRQLLQNLWENHEDVYKDEILLTWHEFDNIYNSRSYKLLLLLQRIYRILVYK